jgi:hypothetical protein
MLECGRLGAGADGTRAAGPLGMKELDIDLTIVRRITNTLAG